MYAWCLMSNHYHLVVRTGPVPLVRSMGHLQSRHAAASNRRWRSNGPLWQSRHKARMVETGGSLRRVIAYVHLNPVTAGVADDPSDYPLSGHRELLRRTSSPLIDPETVLSIYGSSVRSARRAYVGPLDGVAEAGWRSELPGRLPWWRREPDRELAPPTVSAVMDVAGRTSGLEREDVEAEELLEVACRQLGRAVADLARTGNGREVSRLRYLVSRTRSRRSTPDEANRTPCARGTRPSTGPSRSGPPRAVAAPPSDAGGSRARARRSRGVRYATLIPCFQSSPRSPSGRSPRSASSPPCSGGSFCRSRSCWRHG